MKTTTIRIPKPLADELKQEARGIYRSLNSHALALIIAGRARINRRAEASRKQEASS